MADPMMALRLEVVKTFSNDLELCLKNITVSNQTMFYIYLFIFLNFVLQ